MRESLANPEKSYGGEFSKKPPVPKTMRKKYPKHKIQMPINNDLTFTKGGKTLDSKTLKIETGMITDKHASESIGPWGSGETDRMPRCDSIFSPDAIFGKMNTLTSRNSVSVYYLLYIYYIIYI